MGCEIRDHVVDGFRALTLSDDDYSITVLPEKGADIISLRDEKTNTEFLWESPSGLRTDAPSKNFIDNYEGGWQECFPTGGPPLNYRGAAMGQHGEVHTLAWRVIDLFHDAGEASITLETRTIKTPFALRKKITLRNRVGIIEIEEWVTNESHEALPVLWGHHPALGGNFLDSSCKIDAPAKKVWSYVLPEDIATGQFDQNVSGVWPHLVNKHAETVDLSEIAPPESKTADMLFIGDFSDGWISITNRERKVGLAFLFDPQLFPVVWFWQMYGGGTGYPWYGRAYTLALEPFTGVPDPHAESIDGVAGTKIIKGNETVHTRLRVLLYRGIKGVGRITPEGTIVPRI
jgi:galactose mutarotase-like enzyme